MSVKKFAASSSWYPPPADLGVMLECALLPLLPRDESVAIGAESLQVLGLVVPIVPVSVIDVQLADVLGNESAPITRLGQLLPVVDLARPLPMLPRADPGAAINLTPVVMPIDSDRTAGGADGGTGLGIGIREDVSPSAFAGRLSQAQPECRTSPGVSVSHEGYSAIIDAGAFALLGVNVAQQMTFTHTSIIPPIYGDMGVTNA